MTHPTTTPAPAAPPPRRRRRALRITLIVVLALAVALLLAEALGWPFLRGPIELRLAKSLGTEVVIEAPFSVHLLRPPEARAARLRLGAAAGSAAPFLVDAQDVLLRWRWADVQALRRGEGLRLRALEAGRLEAHLLRPEKGPASWQYHPPEEPSSSPPPLPQIERLRLRDARLHVDDAPLALQLEAQARLNDGATAAAGAASRAASAPAAEAGSDAPGLWAEAQGRWRGFPVRASARSSQVLPLLDDGGASVQVSARAQVGKARLAYDGSVADPLGERAIDGAFEVRGPSLGEVAQPLGVTLPTTPPFVLRGRLKRSDPVWHVLVEEATIGRSALRGRFAYDPQPKTPKLSGRLEGRRLALADLAPAVGGDGRDSRPPPNTRNGGPRVIPARAFDLPSLKAMDADVTVALDELDLGSQAVETLRPLAGHVRLDGGVLRIDDLDARTAGGSLAGATQLDSTQSPPVWRADLRWRGVDLAGWLRGVRKDDAKIDARSSAAKLARERRVAKQGDAPVRSYLTGELQGALKLQSQGRSTAQLLANLDGEARAAVRDGTISHLAVEAMGIDIAQALGVFVRGDESLPLNCAVVAVDAKNGVVTPRVAVFDTRDSTLSVTGRVDLRNELLDLRGEVKPKDFSIAALRSPLHVRGPFAKPQVGVDGAPIAARAAGAVALGALLGPLAAIVPLLDPGSGDGPGCGALLAQGGAKPAAPAAKSRP